LTCLLMLCECKLIQVFKSLHATCDGKHMTIIRIYSLSK